MNAYDLNDLGVLKKRLVLVSVDKAKLKKGDTNLTFVIYKILLMMIYLYWLQNTNVVVM